MLKTLRRSERFRGRLVRRCFRLTCQPWQRLATGERRRVDSFPYRVEHARAPSPKSLRN